jgi:micrococcal nuclease
MYEYKAQVIAVYDGDTVTAVVDLGFSVTLKITVRLLGIDTPEVRTGNAKEAAKAARDWLAERVMGKEVIIRTQKQKGSKDKYGRYLALLIIPGELTSINDQAIAAGHGVAYDGGAKR